MPMPHYHSVKILQLPPVVPDRTIRVAVGVYDPFANLFDLINFQAHRILGFGMRLAFVMVDAISGIVLDTVSGAQEHSIAGTACKLRSKRQGALSP